MDGFASLGSPLTTMTQKNVKFKWSGTCELSFKELKKGLPHFGVDFTGRYLGLFRIL